MSRTTRLKSEKWLEKQVLYVWVKTPRKYWQKTSIEKNSKEGKMILSQLHSDTKKRFYNGKGPNEFHNLTAQRPYRRDCKQQINKFMKDPDYEIQLRNKPYREYWD